MHQTDAWSATIQSAPLRGLIAVETGVDYDPALRGIFVNTSGEYVLQAVDGSTATLQLLAGVFYPVFIKRVVSAAGAVVGGV
jgi:hypothetical protein